jgi:hypothetical protein
MKYRIELTEPERQSLLSALDPLFEGDTELMMKLRSAPPAEDLIGQRVLVEGYGEGEVLAVETVYCVLLSATRGVKCSRDQFTVLTGAE